MKKTHHPPLPKDIRVMADYSCSGIWTPGGMLDYEELNLPTELEARFKAWIRSYDGAMGEEFGYPPGFDFEAFDQRGRELAKELKRFCGPEVNVWYYPEVYDGEGAPPLEEIRLDDEC